MTHCTLCIKSITSVSKYEMSTDSDRFIRNIGQIRLSNFLLAGISSIAVTVITNPLDVRNHTALISTNFNCNCCTFYYEFRQVLKTQMQVHGAQTGTTRSNVYRNMVHTAGHLMQQNGIMGLQKGLSAAVAFQFTLNSMR